MAKYQYPGVYVEELSTRLRQIEGVSTSTAGFIGPTRVGPTDRAPVLLTSLGEFESAHGDGSDLDLEDGSVVPHFMWHAARAFFENGGRRLYVAAVRQDAYAAALDRFEGVPEIAIVAAPGVTFGYDRGRAGQSAAIVQALLDHAERTRRFAVIDAGDAQSTSQVMAMRAAFNSFHGGMYYPWIRVADPATGRDRFLPPSGFVAGMYARVDLQSGVHRTPAGHVLHLATGLERDVGPDQAILNSAGINCVRSFPGRGILVWGARTLSSDADWKFVNLRRHVLYLEASIDRSLHRAVFEPNGGPLWNAIRDLVGGFLLNEWRRGALLGNAGPGVLREMRSHHHDAG